MANDKNDFFYELFYSIRKKMLIILYTFCVICIGSFTIFLVNEARVPLRVEFLIGFVIAIIGTIGGLFFSVLLDLPEVGRKFDEIKNDIASGRIKTPEEFATRVSNFIYNHFKFILFNVEYVFIHIVESTCYYSNDVIFDIMGEKELDSIILRSQQTEDVIYIGKYSINKSDYHLYVIPIWFGEIWLGCIGIFNGLKLMKIFTLFLSSFENEYIDDQIFHVLNIRKAAIQKQFYKELDLYSDKISNNEYNNINEYGNEILDLLIRKTECIGGLFATVYEEDCIMKLKDESVDHLKVKNYYKTYFKEYNFASDSRVVSDHNFVFKYVLEIPINIVELRGIICLFDQNPHKFNYFKNMIIEIENIKLDNDLENLAKFLQLSPRENAFIKPSGLIYHLDQS